MNENIKKIKKFFNPSRIVVISFAFTIIIGSLILSLPGTHRINTSYVDSLFMSTSAVCVTGLSLFNISKDFTHFGQYTLMGLFQIGGLGLMTFSVFFLFILRRDISMVSIDTIFNTFSNNKKIRYQELLILIIIFTFIFEGIGALLLSLFFLFYKHYSLFNSIYYGIFHSISAFCNAGFSLFPDSFVRFEKNSFFNIIITSLIIIGGIGFFVILEIYYRFKKRIQIFSLHTKLTLLVTFILITLGTLTIFLIEKDHLFYAEHYTTTRALMSSYFQAVTARTAGFNTINIGLLSPATLFFIIILMFIGASPGSTGGGIKTTTAGVMFAIFINRLKGKQNITLFNRTIGQETISRTISIILSSVILLTLTFLVLIYINQTAPWFKGNHSTIKILFEEVSAFGTVGLSTGITPQMNTATKIITILLMFIGRVGPLALAVAIAGDSKEDKIKYSEENIMVG